MPSDLHIRRAAPADAPAIDALTQAAYAKWVPVIGRKPLPMLADYGEAVRAHRIDVIDAPDGLAALVELEPFPDHLLIVNLAVRPDRHGQGLGSRLLEHAEDVARSLGLPELRLYTNSLMAKNIALYGRRGYVVDRREERGPGWTTVHMSKRLPSA